MNQTFNSYYLEMGATEGFMRAEIEKLEKENNNLKSDLAFKNTMLDNVKAEYESSQDVIKKLNERIKELEKEIEELNKMMLFETKI